LALVNFAKFCGVEYIGTDENNIISVKYEDKKYDYELLETFEFTSSRKRQSIIVRRDNEIWLYTKGADSVLLDPLRLSKNEQE
jgi:phospholipid-transporting ATPase